MLLHNVGHSTFFFIKILCYCKLCIKQMRYETKLKLLSVIWILYSHLISNMQMTVSSEKSLNQYEIYFQIGVGGACVL